MFNSIRTTRIFLRFFLVIGIILIVAGISSFLAEGDKKKNCTYQVEAVVVDEKIKIDTDDCVTHEYHTPIFCYTYEGKEYLVESDLASDPPHYKVGDHLDLNINPSNPEEIYDTSDPFFTIIGWILSITGIVLTLAIIVMLRVFKPRKIDNWR